MSEAMRVACRCGAVEIEISGEPVAQFYCHCDDCQIVHGGAYVPESVYAAHAVRVVRGEPAAWTLKRNPRVTCRDCGTRLFIDVLALRLGGGSTATTFRPGVSSRNSICSASSRFDRSKTAFPISSRGRRGLEVLTKPSIGKLSLE